MADANGETDAATRGKVNAVCRQFLACADEELAHRLQSEEYDLKHQWNRDARKTARVDVPLAKTVYSEEEAKLQRERMDFLQQQSKLVENDAQVARDLQQQEQSRGEREKSLTEKDAEVALQLQKEEERKSEHTAGNIEYSDAQIALELQKQEILGNERQRIKCELEDQVLAVQLQEQEKHLLEMKNLEKQLRDQRQQLELELLLESEMKELRRNGNNYSTVSLRNLRGNRDTVAILRGGSEGFRLSRTDDLSDAEKRALIQMQDEELAKVLQEYEEKKALHGNRNIAAEIERHDAQLARIMQEVEQLELLKRQNGGHVIIHRQTSTSRRVVPEGETYVVYPLPPQVESQHSVNSLIGTPLRTNVRESMEISRTVSVTSADRGQNMHRPSNTSVGAGQPAYTEVNRNRNPQRSTSGNEEGRGRLMDRSSNTSTETIPPVYSEVNRHRTLSNTSSNEEVRTNTQATAVPPAPQSPSGSPAGSATGTRSPIYANMPQSNRSSAAHQQQTTAVSRDGSRQLPNNHSDVSSSAASLARRQSSKDKDKCKQQ